MIKWLFPNIIVHMLHDSIHDVKHDCWRSCLTLYE